MYKTKTLQQWETLCLHAWDDLENMHHICKLDHGHAGMHGCECGAAK